MKKTPDQTTEPTASRRATELCTVSPCCGGEKRRNASTRLRPVTARQAQRGGYNHGLASILCVLFAIAIQGLCYADVTKLSSEDRKALQDSSRFHEVHSTQDLPSGVVALCVDDNGKLADPGQNWNATDAVTDPTLPWKRLIWAALGGEYYIAHYERGGIDHSFHILVAKLTKNDTKPKMVWHAVGRQLKDYAAFLDSLREGKLDDRLDYPR
jgi:hypothetical protein